MFHTEQGDALSQIEAQGPKWFATTHWSVVVMASGEGEDARNALEQLCSAYWYPLYLYVRRQGFDAVEAEDMTQGFFEHLLCRNRLSQADQVKGRFRTFLLSAMQNFLNDRRDHNQRVKRGGRHTIVSWDAQQAESRYCLEPADRATPELLFDRRWAAVVFERVHQRMRTEFHAAGKGSLYDLFSADVDGSELSYAEIAGRLGTSEAAVKSAAHRLRQRLREILWEEVAHTVTSPQDVPSELRRLVTLAAAEGF